MTYSVWAAFLVFILISLAIDLGVLNKEHKVPSLLSSLKMTIVWVMLAVIFAGIIYAYKGSLSSMEFVTGYLVELSLSMDNVFVFMLIFRYFKVPAKHQHRVLFWGVLGAIVMRFIMIFAGVYLVTKFEWIFYLFGAFLIFSAYKLLISNHSNEDHSHESSIVSFLKHHLKISKDFHGSKFVVIENGKRVFTPLLLVLVLIEQTDLVFALDSIPAILAITQDSFIVFSSNIFAILGLRSLYFVLSDVIEKFVYLHYSLAVILGYVGAKMILAGFGIKISMLLSLLVIFGSLGIAILASIIKAKREQHSA